MSRTPGQAGCGESRERNWRRVFEPASHPAMRGPPSLPEFRAMCLPERLPLCHQHIAGRADLAYVALPRPPMAPEKREECLRKIRAALTK